METKTDYNLPAVYRIEIKEGLEPGWDESFAGFSLSRRECGGTLLRGSVPDQAALFGLIRRIRDLGLTLISLQRIDPGK